MIDLVEQMVAGVVAALLLAVPIGISLAMLLGKRPLFPVVGSAGSPQPTETVGSVRPVAVTRLDPESERVIAALAGNLDNVDAVILRRPDASGHLGVLMSIDRFELLRGKEAIINDPEHLKVLVTVAERGRSTGHTIPLAAVFAE